MQHLLQVSGFLRSCSADIHFAELGSAIQSGVKKNIRQPVDLVDLHVRPDLGLEIAIAAEERLKRALSVRDVNRGISASRGIVGYLQQSRVGEARDCSRKFIDSEVNRRLQDEQDTHAVRIGSYFKFNGLEFSAPL